MFICSIYCGESIESKIQVYGQLIIVGKRFYISDDTLDDHSFYAVNPDSFIEVDPKSVRFYNQRNIKI